MQKKYIYLYIYMNKKYKLFFLYYTHVEHNVMKEKRDAKEPKKKTKRAEGMRRC